LIKKTGVIISAFFLLLTISGCAAEKYGAGINKDVPTVNVRDAMFNPAMNGKLVNLEGIIITQCQSPDGCWIFLRDGTGRIFITTKPGGPNDPAPPPFTLPPRTGKKAKVTGTIHHTPQGIYMIAQGVEIR
jgi:hypothetical protein